MVLSVMFGNSLKPLSPWLVFTVALSTISVCLAYRFVWCLVSLNVPRHIYGKMCGLMNDNEKKYHCDGRCARRVKLNLEYKKETFQQPQPIYCHSVSFHQNHCDALCRAWRSLAFFYTLIDVYLFSINDGSTLLLCSERQKK